jgi:hypothetical protein
LYMMAGTPTKRPPAPAVTRSKKIVVVANGKVADVGLPRHHVRRRLELASLDVRKLLDGEGVAFKMASLFSVQYLMILLLAWPEKPSHAEQQHFSG